jgi:hypothetical protein
MFTSSEQTRLHRCQISSASLGGSNGNAIVPTMRRLRELDL